MVEQFIRDEFENALPVSKVTGDRLWASLGLVDGEFAYIIPVTPYASIMVRSSVKANGISASNGKDSIRMWIVDPSSMKPRGSKIDSYTKRTIKWKTTMLDKLRVMYQLAKKVQPCSCGKGYVVVNRVVKDGPNHNRLFTACTNFGCDATQFSWVA